MTLHSEIPQVIIKGDNICVTSLVVVDQTLAAYMEKRQPEERLKVMEQALRIGLMALQSAVGSIDVDYVGRAVKQLIADTKQSNERAIEEVKKSLKMHLKRMVGPCLQDLKDSWVMKANLFISPETYSIQTEENQHSVVWERLWRSGLAAVKVSWVNF